MGVEDVGAHVAARPRPARTDFVCQPDPRLIERVRDSRIVDDHERLNAGDLLDATLEESLPASDPPGNTVVTGRCGPISW